MITALLTKFALGRAVSAAVSKVPWQVWAIALLLGAGWFIDYRAYNRGYNTATNEWVAMVEAETGRQREANAVAQEWARGEVARLETVREERNALLEELDLAAATDPDADSVCLGPDSVFRLNLGDEPEANP